MVIFSSKSKNEVVLKSHNVYEHCNTKLEHLTRTTRTRHHITLQKTKFIRLSMCTDHPAVFHKHKFTMFRSQIHLLQCHLRKLITGFKLMQALHKTCQYSSQNHIQTSKFYFFVRSSKNQLLYLTTTSRTRS